MASELKKLNLGQKIKRLRERQGISPKEFASRFDLSESLLTHLESNEIMAPVATLINMAHAFGEELGYFLEPEKEGKPYSVVKKGKAKPIQRSFPQGKNPQSYSYKSLAPDKSHKRMEPFLVEFAPGRESVPQVAHDGEEFVYLLSGTLECRYKNEKIRLNAGDSFYFESQYPHAFRAIGKKKAVALVVLHPH